MTKEQFAVGHTFPQANSLTCLTYITNLSVGFAGPLILVLVGLLMLKRINSV